MTIYYDNQFSMNHVVYKLYLNAASAWPIHLYKHRQLCEWKNWRGKNRLDEGIKQKDKKVF